MLEGHPYFSPFRCVKSLRALTSWRSVRAMCHSQKSKRNTVSDSLEGSDKLVYGIRDLTVIAALFILVRTPNSDGPNSHSPHPVMLNQTYYCRSAPLRISLRSTDLHDPHPGAGGYHSGTHFGIGHCVSGEAL